MKMNFLFKDRDTVAMVAENLMVSGKLPELQVNHHQHQRHRNFEKNSLEFMKKFLPPSKG